MWVLDFSQLLLICLIVSVTNDSNLNKKIVKAVLKLFFTITK